MAQGSGVLFNPIYMPGWMANKVRTKLVQGLQIGLWEEPAIGQNRVQSLDRMSFTLHKSITIWIVKGSGVQSQDSVIERVEYIDTREAAPGMSGSSVFNNGENGFSVLERFAFKLLNGERGFHRLMHVYARTCNYVHADRIVVKLFISHSSHSRLLPSNTLTYS